MLNGPSIRVLAFLIGQETQKIETMTTQNPIIFLDFDGVMNSQLWFTELTAKKLYSQRSQLEPRAASLLNELCKKTGAKIVVTSVWRLNRTVEELQGILNQSGCTAEVIGKTEDLRYGEAGDCVLRGNEILHWIKEHDKLCGNPSISYHLYTRYVIFDDDSDMLYWQKDNYIHVDPYCGLTPHNVFMAKRILGMPEDEKDKYAGEAVV